MRKMYIMLIVLSILITPVIGDDNSTKKPITYRVIIDDQQGFYMVYDTVSNKIIPYQNRTLNIYRGDTVIWINDVDRRLTVVSEQKLWDDKSGHLAQEYKIFNYTFTEPGVYDVYIKEYLRLKQKIIVNPIEQYPTSENITNKSDITCATTVEQNSTSKNMTDKLDLPCITIVEQNSTSNVSNMVQDKTIYDDIKSRLDTAVLILVLLSIYVLSDRIKE